MNVPIMNFSKVLRTSLKS